MEHLQLSASPLAEEYFRAAEAINAADPLLLNELGVVAYNKDELVMTTHISQKELTVRNLTVVVTGKPRFTSRRLSTQRKVCKVCCRLGPSHSAI